MTEVLDPKALVDDESTVEDTSFETPRSPWQDLLGELAASVQQAEGSLRSQIHEEVESPFREALANAISESRKALDQYEKDSPDLESDADRWRAIGSYRSAIEQNVVTPIARYLRDGRPGPTLAEAFQDMFVHLTDSADAVPESIELGEVGDALNRRRGDPRTRLVRKAIARKLYRARPAPVRLLIRYHTQVRFARALSRKRDASHNRLATCLVWLETGVSRWTHIVLAAEESLDDDAGFVDRSKVESDNSESVDDGREGEADKLSYEDLRAEILSAGSALIDALSAAAGKLEELYVPFSEDELADLHAFLDYDLRAIGTFLLSEKDRQLPKSDYLPAKLAVQSDELWAGYQDESRNRIRLNQHLLRIRASLIAVIHGMLDQVRSATVVPLRDIYSRFVDGIEREAAEIRKLFEESSESDDLEKVAEKLLSIADKATTRTNEISDQLGGVNAADAALRDLGLGEWKRSRREVDQLPAKSVIHAVDLEGDPRPVLFAPRSSVNMKQIVNEVLSIRFVDQLKKPAKQLRRAVARRWGDVLMVADTISFNARAAAEKLTDVESDNPLEDAQEVITDGLSRALERSRGAMKALDAPWAEFNDSAVAVMMNLWRLIHRRIKSAELESAQWADLGSRLSVVSQSYWLKIKNFWHTLREHLHIWGRFVRMKGSVLIRKGQTAVGVSVSSDSEITATIDAIRNFEQVDENMPFIYRKLFTLDALDDPSFLEGRAIDISTVKSHFDRWKRGNQASVLIVSSNLGSGRTSFLNTLDELVFEDAEVYSVHLRQRCRSEEELAGIIASTLEVPVDGPASFASLKSALARRHRKTPIVCRFYELEHTVLTVPGGTRLLSDLLLFLSATDQYVYWIGGISELCRQFLERTSQTEGLVRFLDLSPLSPGEFEALILNRHRRSGIELSFEPPDGLSTLMRQRLNRATSEEDRQEILKEAFFDRLSKFTEQDLRLALFAWLQSVRFDEKGDSASVVWRLALDFGWLSGFDRQWAFSLRSLLFHKTLTVEEHAEIFRMSLDQSVLVMESFFNTGLITPSDGDDTGVGEIELGKRYRIHPLMQGPVRQHLVGRHMVY